LIRSSDEFEFAANEREGAAALNDAYASDEFA
jgi:hypothetical protein